MGNAMAEGSRKKGPSGTPVADDRHANAGEQNKGPVERAHHRRRSQPTVEASLHDRLRQVDVDHGNDVVTRGTRGVSCSLPVCPNRACNHHSSWLLWESLLSTIWQE